MSPTLRARTALVCVIASTLLTACGEAPPPAPGDYASMSVEELREAWVELHALHTTPDPEREARWRAFLEIREEIVTLERDSSSDESARPFYSDEMHQAVWPSLTPGEDFAENRAYETKLHQALSAFLDRYIASDLPARLTELLAQGPLHPTYTLTDDPLSSQRAKAEFHTPKVIALEQERAQAIIAGWTEGDLASCLRNIRVLLAGTSPGFTVNSGQRSMCAPMRLAIGEAARRGAISEEHALALIEHYEVVGEYRPPFDRVMTNEAIGMIENSRTYERIELDPRFNRDRAARDFVRHSMLIVELSQAEDRAAYEAIINDIDSRVEQGDWLFSRTSTGIRVPMATHFDIHTQTALAHLGIRVFALRDGRLPANLSEVIDAGILTRPPHADGRPHEPLGYRTDPNDPAGYVLYAFGHDGEDNNGTPDPEGLNPGPGFDRVYSSAEDRLILERLPPG